MQYTLTKLPNGLKVLTVPMPSLESATLTVWAKTGSRYEDPSLAGISHFLEHMAFKGGKKYKNARAVSETVDAIGGEFNAGTSKEWTNFYIRSRANSLETAFDVLSDMLLTPSLRAGDIERERGVIIEEINMYEDTPMYRIGDLFEQLIFKGNSLGVDIIGSKKTVKAISRKDFVNYRKKHYFGENMLITVSGGIDTAKIVSLAKKYFGTLESRGGKVEGPAYKSLQKHPQVLLSSKSKEQANLILGFPTYKLGAETRYTEVILSTILGGGMSSRLFTEVREKRGLAYSVYCYLDHFVETGYIAANAGVDPKRVDEAIKVIYDQFLKLATARHGVSEAELNKAKEYVKGHLALSLESTKSINNFFGHDELLLGKVTTPEEDIKAYDKVSIQDVHDLAKELVNPQKVNLAVIGPYKNRQHFVKLLSE